MRKICLVLAFTAAITLSAFGQATLTIAKPGTAAIPKTIDQQFVEQQFGSEFTLLPEFKPAYGDLDGDGVEDVIIAARCKSPLFDQAEHNFTVIDPLDEYYGYGDPKITSTFPEGVPERRGMAILIIHGAGPEAWRSQKPKAKYVIINLPYREISIRKLQVNKKKSLDALYIKEADSAGTSSAVFFDGKKFHYVPMGADME